MKRPHTSSVLGFLCGLAIIAGLVTLNMLTACTGPSQTTTGYIEWNIQPSTTQNANTTPARPPSPPTPPR